jgi:hypothetical protein
MYKIYWTNPDSNDAYSGDFEDLTKALKECEMLRREGRTFVTMVSENPNHVGKTGAVGVVDGKLPDGSPYSWTKDDRVGAAFKNKSPAVSTDNLVVNLDDPR